MSNFPDSHHQMPFGYIDFPSLPPPPPPQPTVNLHPLFIHNFPTPRNFRAHSNYGSFRCSIFQHSELVQLWKPPEKSSTVDMKRNKNCFFLSFSRCRWCKRDRFHKMSCQSDQKFYLIHLNTDDENKCWW